jgi:hypothetical protein
MSSASPTKSVKSSARRNEDGKAQFRVQCEEDHPSGDSAAIDKCVTEKFVAAHPKSH